MEYISYEDFKKLDMRVGTIRFVEVVPEADKLLRCLIDFGPEIATMQYTDEAGVEYPVRQIVSGIREYLGENIQSLVGRQLLYVVNLEPRVIKGVESQGMLMAVGDEAHPFICMIPDTHVTSGAKIR